MMRRILVAAVAAFCLLALAATGVAAKPAKVSYSISVDQAAPVFGGQVTFTYAPDPVVGNIVLECFQAGVKVSSETHAANADGWSYHLPFTLGPTYLWTGGAASCTATLSAVVRGHKIEPVASTSFQVSA